MDDRRYPGDGQFGANLSVADRFERMMGSQIGGDVRPCAFRRDDASGGLCITCGHGPHPRRPAWAAHDGRLHPTNWPSSPRRLTVTTRWSGLCGCIETSRAFSPTAQRYSALSPEPWNWNLISIFFMHRGAFHRDRRRTFEPDDNQAIWDRFRQMCDGLQMPGRARQLAERYEDLCAYYDKVADETLAHTESLDIVIDATLRPRRPDYVPSMSADMDADARPAGHLVAVLGFGIMHPKVRAMLPIPWTRRHDIEFAVATRLLRLAYRWLPARLSVHTVGAQQVGVRPTCRPLQGARPDIVRAGRNCKRG